MTIRPVEFPSTIQHPSHGVFQQPVSCKDGHTFCSECFELWLKTSKTCPLDNTVISDNNLVRNLTVSNIVDNLYVYCVAKDEENKENSEPKAKKIKQEHYEGTTKDVCDWKGKLQELKKHQEVCSFYEVQCPHANCTDMVQRRHIGDHSERCMYRIVTCKECQAQVIQHDVQHHQDNDCPDTMIPCTNNCFTNGETTKIIRSTMKDHLDNKCDNTSVTCPFSDQGCSEQVLRKHVDKHLQDKMSSHMLLLAKENTQITKINSVLTQRSESLNDKLTAMKEEVKTLKSTLSDVKESFEDKLSKANSYTWTIPDYPTLCNKYTYGSSFNSPFFWLCGYKLRLLLYPNGVKEKGRSSLSLYLTLYEDYPLTSSVAVVPSKATISFRLTVVSQVPGVNDVSHKGTNAVFDKNRSNLGWHKFITTADTLSSSYCNVTDKSLRIKCTIYPET